MKHTTRRATLDLSGLTDRCRPALARFGRRGTGVIVTTPGLTIAVDAGSGLPFFPLDEVFVGSPVLLGIGTPNSYLVVPSLEGNTTEKLAAFMFWRQKAAVVPTKGRVQAGVLFELTGLTGGQTALLQMAVRAVSGRRGASCARQCAHALHLAGFRLGSGRSLKHVYRPSRLASLIWRFGLEYDDAMGVHAVKLRVIHASPTGFGDHFVGVWKREANAACRAAEKQYRKRRPTTKPPIFEPAALPALNPERWTGPVVELGIARSNRLGANLTFLAGQKPVYVAKLPGLSTIPALRTPLRPFPVIKDKVTWLKRHVLFARPVITLINRSRIAAIDWYVDGLKADMAIDMLTPSLSANYNTATLYNCVVTSSEMRLTALHTREIRDQQSKLIHRLNWVAAKHVLLSDYDPDVVFACELWAYRNEAGQPVLCINSNSGTYKPSSERMEAFASHLRQVFGVQVQTFTMGEAE
jgi:hypothetical protein